MSPEAGNAPTLARRALLAGGEYPAMAHAHPGSDPDASFEPAARASRLATRADSAAIRRVITDAYSRYLNRMDRPPAPMMTDYGPAISRGQVWVLGEPIIGVIVLIPELDRLLVENVAVSPAAQGAGNGRRLMEFAEQQAISAGLNRLTLYTNEVMAENIAIYARLGYRETERRAEDGYRRVFMEKLLPHNSATGSGEGRP
jgi:GNAT superfamily N-acetyltransferase